MKAVILPAANIDLLHPVNNWTPEFLIPVVNKPIVEHLVELLLIHNIRDIEMVLKHMPYETEHYFEKGERWGCNISYSLERTYEGILPSLMRIQSRLNDSFICLPGNTITNMDISSLINIHEKNGADITFPVPDKQQGLSDINEFYPFIMNPRTLLPLVKSFSQTWTLRQIIDKLSREEHCRVHFCEIPFDYCPLHNMKDYMKINSDILNEQIKGINIPGRQIKKGVWVGRQTHIHPEAKIKPPVLIGSNCNIHSLASIGENTVVGDNVIVDSDADIKTSIIFNNTYIGAHTEIRDSIIRENFMFNMQRMFKLYVSDDFILGKLDKNILVRKLGRFMNITAALFMLILFSPVILSYLLLHIMLPSKKFLFKEERYGAYTTEDLTGELIPSVMDLFFFRSGFGLIKKLPGLINVIRGDLNLVGNSTLTRDEAASLTEEWEKIRFYGPSGLFHLWEVEQNHDISWEEKITSENYYASTRTFRGDVMILLKYFIPAGKAVCIPGKTGKAPAKDDKTISGIYTCNSVK